MITIGSSKLSTADFERVLYQDEKIGLEETRLKEVSANFDFLKSYARQKIIYGINTGLGPMAQYKISEEDQQQLQYNLIRSHCTGAGQPFSEDLSRATLLARLNSLMMALSGVHPSVVMILKDFLNERVSACIFEKGGVGASGDLIQLAHLALNLIGEGEVMVKGEFKPARQVFSQKKWAPLQIHLREGLALINGTSAMTGVGVVNMIHARKLLNCSIILSAITNELMKSFDENFYHGGNFHGDYVSLAMDKLKIVITKLTMLSERQLNYLLNDKLNQKLPPFINLGKLGLNFGLQGMQFTATSTTAENQTLSYPMYLHSISNNNDNQDIVSMGCNAALLTRRVIDNGFDVLAVQAIAVAQAIDYLKCQQRISSFTERFYNEMRSLVKPITEDEPQYQNMKTVKEYLGRLGSAKII